MGGSGRPVYCSSQCLSHAEAESDCPSFYCGNARADIRIQIAKRDNVSRKRLRFSQPNSRNQMTWRILSRRHSRYAYSQATQKTILTGIFEFRSTGKNRPRSESKTAPIMVSHAEESSATRVLQTAIAHYTSKGNFRRAATHQQVSGRLCYPPRSRSH
jgi:hypothetical protein